jgi:hypothetical protein
VRVNQVYQANPEKRATEVKLVNQAFQDSLVPKDETVYQANQVLRATRAHQVYQVYLLLVLKETRAQQVFQACRDSQVLKEMQASLAEMVKRVMLACLVSIQKKVIVDQRVNLVQQDQWATRVQRECQVYQAPKAYQDQEDRPVCQAKMALEAAKEIQDDQDNQVSFVLYIYIYFTNFKK